MKGWLFTKTGVPIRLIEKADPHAAPGEVVVDIKASGLCHSDVAALEDPTWMKLFTAAPVIFGHECAGVICEVGEGVTEYKVGDRVGLVPLDPLDPTKAIGYSRDGGYATKVSAPVRHLVPIPDGVNFLQGAAATDAGATSYHALFTVGGAQKDMRVAIIGIGGLGQFAAQMAMIAGCETYAVDTNAEARKLAEDMGCKKVFSSTADLAEVSPQVIVDYAGFGSTTADAVEAAAPGGTIVVVGMGVLQATINTYAVITKHLSIRGSLGGTAEDIRGVYEFFLTGRLNPQLSTIPFDKIDEGLEMLRQGKVKGRLVAVQDETL